MMTVDELIELIPFKVAKLMQKPMCKVWCNDVGEPDLDSEDSIYRIDNLCLLGHDASWKEVIDRWDEIEVAAQEYGCHILQSSGNYTCVYIYKVIK